MLRGAGGGAGVTFSIPKKLVARGRPLMRVFDGVPMGFPVPTSVCCVV